MTKRKRFKSDNVVVVATVVVCFTLTLTACYFLGGQGLVDSVFGKSNGGGSYFFITTSGHEDTTLAHQNADLIRLRGGAGYVDLRQGNEVVIAVYPTSASAQSVLSKLGDGSLVVREVPLSSYKIKVKDKALSTSLTSAAEAYNIAFDTLYNLSNSLANSALTVENVNVQIKILHSKIDEIKCAFYENTQESNLDVVTEMKVALVTCLAIIDGVLIEGEVATLSSLRRQCVQLAYCHQALSATLASM